MSYDDDRRAEKRAARDAELAELRRKAEWHDTHPDNAGVPEDPFETELRQLINKHSKEQGSNTADFVLASYLRSCLDVFDYHLRYRDSVQTLPPKTQAQHEREMREAGLNVGPKPQS